MKKIIIIALLIVIAGCASKEPPFDEVAVFRESEENMRVKAFEKARKGYQQIQEKAPDKSYNADLMLRIADTYFGEELYSEAQVEYQAFLNFHPVNKNAAYAQFQIAMCSYNELSTIDRDPTPAHVAIKEMRRVLEKYPKSGYEEQAIKYIAICTDRIAEYELYVARFYHKKGSYKAAAGRCDELLKNYPDSLSAKDALYYAGLSYAELGELDLAKARFETLAQEYPAMKKTALFHINELYTP